MNFLECFSLHYFKALTNTVDKFGSHKWWMFDCSTHIETIRFFNLCHLIFKQSAKIDAIFSTQIPVMLQLT